jgi:hypothetical protein
VVVHFKLSLFPIPAGLLGRQFEMHPTNWINSKFSSIFVVMKQRIYLDTSVIGGYLDAEFASETIPFFERVRRGEYTILLSDILEQELALAPLHVKTLLQAVLPEYVERITSTPEVVLPATRYIDAKVVGKTIK